MDHVCYIEKHLLKISFKIQKKGKKMDIKTIIAKKRDRKELTEEEIKLFVGKYQKGEISEAQAGALLSYIYKDGMTENEIIAFALAMANSGQKINLDDISQNIVDKHSTGGVGDKVTLILMPVIAALGIPIAKVSSRGMGITGGTIDKFESIPGYNTEISMETFKENIKEYGVGILNQSENLNPAESKIYKLRNEIACTDCVPIIAASLMSIKLLTGSQKIVFEITYGNGTYIKTKDQAKRLARILKMVGKKLNKGIMSVITNVDEPLGYSIGHNLEMIEAIQSLKGKMPEDLGDVVVTIGSVILALATKSKNLKANEDTVKEVIRNGKAYEKFLQMIAAQGGNTSYIENPDLFEKAEFVMPVYSSEEGYIEKIDADIVGSIAGYLGAGRMNEEDKIDRTAGIVLNKKIGDDVKSGEIVAYIHTNDESKVMGATKNLAEAFKIVKRKIYPTSRVVEII